MKVKIRRVVNRFEATPAELAADYKFRGLDKYQAWDSFVIDRGLRPEIDAKGFYLIYSEIVPDDLEKFDEVDFYPTHLDALLERKCQVTTTEDGAHHIVWDFGMTGMYPLLYEDEFNRRFLPFDGNKE